MDAALRPWLYDSFSADLLLGLHWFQQKVEQELEGAKQKASWSDYYRDDGSSLIINPGYHDRKSNLRLAQVIAVCFAL